MDNNKLILEYLDKGSKLKLYDSILQGILLITF